MAAPAGSYWFHRHPVLTASALVLVGCVLALILAELCVRVLLPEWGPTRQERVRFWAYDELLGWAHRPNEGGRFEHPDFSVEIVTNSHGMRDSEYSLARTGKKRMLVLGDSMAWGFGVEHRERFSEILESAHPDWEIINASVSGYGSDQEFLLLKERAMAFRPDAVLLLFHENDFDNNIYPVQAWYYKPFFVVVDGRLELRHSPVPRASIRQLLVRFLLGKTYLAAGLHNRLIVPLAQRRRPGTVTGSQVEKKKRDVTYRLLAAISDLCRQNGAAFILVSVPMDAPKRAFLQELAEREKIPYLPLDPSFESPAAAVTFPHDAHWNARGHAVAAGAIDAFLWKSGLLDASRPQR